MKNAKPYFRSFYRGNGPLWALVMGMTMVMAVGDPLFSWILKEAADVIYTGDLDWLVTLGKISVLGLVAFGGLELLRVRIRAVFVRRAMENYKTLAFSELSRKGISTFARENTSRYVSVLTNDLPYIDVDYLSNTFHLVYLVLSCLGSGVLLFYYGGILAWIILGFSLVPIGLGIFMGKELTRRTKALSDQDEHFVAQLKDLLSGFAVLKSFKAEEEASKLFHRASHQRERVKEHRSWWNGMLFVVQSNCAMALQMGTVLVGGYLAIRGEITPGTAVVMVNLCGQIVNPLSTLPQILASRKAAKGLVQKMAELMQENTQQTGELMPPVLENAIVFDHVSFGYEVGQPVLRDINLAMEAGKRYAIVGVSGSGKSTLLNLLMGAYGDYSGSITVDGRELNTLAPDSLYDLMSLIGQNVFLFDNTIRENITMFRDFPSEAVDSAVERSGLANVIAAKGEGYRCGENGNGLSGGERQRVSIARSLLRGNQVLMLDEATASLDNQTAFEVTDAILKLDGLTRIVVTHRLEEKLLEQYDEIFVLKDGKIMEQGTFGELMAKVGYFYSLYHMTN